MARGCGAKRICKSKCTKNISVGPILPLLIRKTGTLLWREAHWQVKMYEIPASGTIFEVQMSKNGTSLRREAHWQVKMCKIPPGGTNFGSSDVEKWQAAVARSRFVSQNAQKTSPSEPFSEVRLQKCHVAAARSTFESQSAQKTPLRGANFGSSDVEKCAPLWRKAHLQVKMRYHFLKGRCPKIARLCGAKQICKSNSTKDLCFAAFLDVSNWLTN